MNKHLLAGVLLALSLTLSVYGQAGQQIVQGNVASGATDSGNPVKVGAVYNSGGVTPSNGQRIDLQADANGYLEVNVKAGSSGNGAASNTGSSVPTQADYSGLNVSGTLRGQTGVNPSGSVYAAQTDMTSVAGTSTVTAASGVQMVGVEGHAGGAFDAAQNAAAPANVLQVAGAYNSTLPSITSGNVSAFQVDAKGQLLADLNYVAGAAWSTAASGIPKVGLTDGSGNSISSTSNALNVDITNSSLPVTQSGNWLMIPKTSCTGTATDSGFINNVTTAGSTLVSATFCPGVLFISNTSSSNTTFTVTDNSTNCSSAACTYISAAPIAANSAVAVNFGYVKFASGLIVKAGASSAIQAQAFGFE